MSKPKGYMENLSKNIVPQLINCLSFVLAMVFITSCGGKDPAAPVIPAPSTPIQVSAPTGPIPPPQGSLVPGTNCPSISGDRNLRQDSSPFLGQFQGSNSLTLGIYFSRYGNYDTPIQNVVSAGQFTFPDMVYFTGMPIPNQNYNLCVSSIGFNNAPATQGIFNLQDLSVAMIVRGYVDVPLISPYGSYPGTYYSPGSNTPTTGKETIELAVGNGYDCPAYLSQGRIYGCVEVRMGQRPPFRLQSR